MCVFGVERSPSVKASADVCGVGGVETGGNTEAVATGADIVVLVSLQLAQLRTLVP